VAQNMDDKIPYTTELQQQMLTELNAVLGTKVKSFDELTALKNTLPEDFLKLQSLCVFYESGFLKCYKAKAYFLGCLSGAAMIEAFLLMLCWLNKNEVMMATSYQKQAKTKTFEKVWGSLSFETLIEIAEELKWITTDLVKMDLKNALALGYEEIAAAKGLDAETIVRGKEAFMLHPAIALFDLVRSLRNFLHAGRWVRQNKVFNVEPFEEWCHLGIALIAELRDCLVVKFTRDLQDKFKKSVVEFEDAIKKLQNLIIARQSQ
jgi:hypothetical protein